MHSTVVKGGAHLVGRYPAPGEFDIGEVAGLADSGNVYEFTARDLDAYGAILGKGARNQRANSLHSERGEQHVPAGRRLDSVRTFFCSVPMIHPRRCKTIES